MASIFDFNDDNPIDDEINMDELYEKKRHKDEEKLNTYRKMLNRIHNKIKITARQNNTTQCCWYSIPEIILGIPHYSQPDCIAYVANALKTNGFNVQYTHPNLLFVSWNHWVPTYVREQIKERTGVQLDGNGVILNRPKPPQQKPNNNDTQGRPFTTSSGKTTNFFDKRSIYHKDLFNYLNNKL